MIQKLPAGIVFDHNKVRERAAIRLYAPATAFGDMWRICSQACRLVSLGYSVSINPVSQRCGIDVSKMAVNRQVGVDHSDFLCEILSLLTYGDCVTVSKLVETNCWIEVNAYLSGWPTVVRWRNGRDVVCYQFDGYGDAERKNPPKCDVDAFICRCWEMDLEPVNLGGWRCCVESVGLAASALCYVGCDSGLAQLAYSVGVPVDLVMYGSPPRALRNWHGKLPRRVFRSLRGWAPISVRIVR